MKTMLALVSIVVLMFGCGGVGNEEVVAPALPSVVVAHSVPSTTPIAVYEVSAANKQVLARVELPYPTSASALSVKFDGRGVAVDTAVLLIRFRAFAVDASVDDDTLHAAINGTPAAGIVDLEQQIVEGQPYGDLYPNLFPNWHTTIFMSASAENAITTQGTVTAPMRSSARLVVVAVGWTSNGSSAVSVIPGMLLAQLTPK